MMHITIRPIPHFDRVEHFKAGEYHFIDIPRETNIKILITLIKKIIKIYLNESNNKYKKKDVIPNSGGL